MFASASHIRSRFLIRMQICSRQRFCRRSLWGFKAFLEHSRLREADEFTLTSNLWPPKKPPPFASFTAGEGRVPFLFFSWHNESVWFKECTSKRKGRVNSRLHRKMLKRLTSQLRIIKDVQTKHHYRALAGKQFKNTVKLYVYNPFWQYRGYETNYSLLTCQNCYKKIFYFVFCCSQHLVVIVGIAIKANSTLFSGAVWFLCIL